MAHKQHIDSFSGLMKKPINPFRRLSTLGSYTVLNFETKTHRRLLRTGSAETFPPLIFSLLWRRFSLSSGKGDIIISQLKHWAELDILKDQKGNQKCSGSVQSCKTAKRRHRFVKQKDARLDDDNDNGDHDDDDNDDNDDGKEHDEEDDNDDQGDDDDDDGGNDGGYGDDDDNKEHDEEDDDDDGDDDGDGGNDDNVDDDDGGDHADDNNDDNDDDENHDGENEKEDDK